MSAPLSVLSRRDTGRPGGSRPANGEEVPLDVEAGGAGIAAGDGTPGGIRALWQVEKDTIERAIEICEGNIPRAAAHLGISASTIYRKRMAWQAEGRA